MSIGVNEHSNLGQGAQTATSRPQSERVMAEGEKAKSGHVRQIISSNLTKSSVDAIDLLKADHEKIRMLFAEFEKVTTDVLKISVAKNLCEELTIHSAIEEELFYPPARAALQDDALLDEAAIEHESAEELISQIKSGSPGLDKWEVKIKVLGERISHHIKEEETEMFPVLRITDIDLKELGAKIAARKIELAL